MAQQKPFVTDQQWIRLEPWWPKPHLKKWTQAQRQQGGV